MKKWMLAMVVVCLTVVPVSSQVPDEFTNLKIFPEDIGRRDLIGAMRGFAGALGVRCNYCHVGPDNLEGMDFATDELETKRVARAMMRMTDQINGPLLSATKREVTMSVRCVTCHRGVARPEQLDDILTAAIEKDGVDGAIARYNELREEHYGSGSYNFSVGTLNGVAETLAGQKQDADGAIKILELNAKHHPDAAYTLMMLGQLHMMKGDKAAAQSALERAIELEPDNDRAKAMLERVKSSE